MSGIKYVLTNNTTLAQFFDYRTLAEAMWFYQVQLNPGQTKTIWAETGSLKIYNNGAITIEEQSVFPPTNPVTGGNNGTNTFIDYNNKSILIFSQLPDSNNLGYSILDFDNNVIVGPVDLGYDRDNGNWFVDDIYPFTNSGYAIYLYDDDNCDKAAIYLDYRGTIIGQYSATTCDRNYDMFGGKYSYFKDNINGVMVYSDGKTFNTFEFNTGYTTNVNSTYDGCTKDGFIISAQLNNYASYSIVTMDGIIPLTNWNTNSTDIEIFQYQNSSFYTTLNYITSGGTYLSFNIYSSNGATLQSVNLTQDDDYTNFDLNFFGTNKMNIIFYNESEGGNSIPYLIYTYDGETDTLISTTHDRINYPSWTKDYIDLYGGLEEFPSQDIHINFYNGIGTDGDFFETDYYNILSYFSGDTEYRTPYVINNDDTTNWVAIDNGFQGSSLIKFYHNTDGFLQLLVITSDDVNINTVTPLGPLSFDFDTWRVGDIFIFFAYTNSPSEGTIFAYDAMGNQLNYLLFYDYNFNSGDSYGTFYVETGTGLYYFNSSTLKFLPLGDYNFSYQNLDRYYTDTFKLNGNILIYRYNDNAPICRLLSENNITPEVTLPATYGEGSTLRVGKDVILYIYINQNNRMVINLYNTSFGLLQSLTTNFNSWNDSFVSENRAFVNVNNAGVYTNYMVSANGIKSIQSTTSSDSWMANDYFWWSQLL
jgi:hypothetical protein